MLHHGQMGCIPPMQDWFNIQKSINIIHHVKRLKNKTNHDITGGAEKAFDKV